MSATITQRPDGRYVAAPQIEGKRHWLYGSTEEEVQAKLDALHQKLGMGQALPSAGKRNVCQLLSSYLEAASLKTGSRRTYERLIRVHLEPALGRVWLVKLTPERIRAAYREIAPDHPCTRQMCHIILRKALKWAIRQGWLVDNPTDQVDPPRYRAGRKTVWSQEQALAFLAATRDETYGPLWVMLAYTGCRLSEMIGLTWDRVDLSRHTIFIQDNLQYLGKLGWKREEPKTQAGYRSIQLPHQAMAVLRELRLKAGGNSLVFHTLSGSPLHSQNVEMGLRRACARHGLPRISPHSLRHLHATLLLSQNVPIPVVSARLGHAHPGITMKVYAHALKRQDDLAAQAIERSLG